MELRSIEAIIHALNSGGIRYIVVGGLAVNAHGYLRMTCDIDLVIQLEPKNIINGLNALLEIGYQLAHPVNAKDFAIAEVREQWLREKQMIVLKLWSNQHQRTPIDIFVYEPFDFESEFAKALNLEVAPGLTAPVVSLTTLLEMKRIAARPSDLNDIEELNRSSDAAKRFAN